MKSPIISVGLTNLRSIVWFYLFFLICVYVYLTLAALGLHWCGRVFSAMSRAFFLLQARASHCCGLSCCRAQALELWPSSCGPQAQLSQGMWDLPGPGIEPVSPALAGRLPTTEPTGSPWWILFWYLDRGSTEFTHLWTHHHPSWAHRVHTWHICMYLIEAGWCRLRLQILGPGHTGGGGGARI